MRRSGWQFLVLVSVVLALAPAEAAQRPRYGGVLRITMQEAVRTLDPAEWVDAVAEIPATERLAGLIFDRLVRLDSKGELRPSLALSWRSDSGKRRWEFRLRPGVRFHDGSQLTPQHVVNAVGSVLKRRRVSAGEDVVVVQSEQAVPELPVELAGVRGSVFTHDSGGALLGTGPFRLAEWKPNRHLSLTANDQYWGGRPFLDSVEIEMGRASRDQLVDLELSKADWIEVSPNQVRNCAQRGTRLWSSFPVEVMALVFQPNRAPVQDARIREAVALSIDRSSIHSVLFQGQGVLSGGLLPQWLSGYTFLFPTARNLERAKQIVSGLSILPQPLSITVDSSDLLERSVAERIAVNAREAGILLRVTAVRAPRSAETLPNNADARVVRLSARSADPAQVLREMVTALGLPVKESSFDLTTSEGLYAFEQKQLAGFWVIPLVHLPEIYGVSSRVRSWIQPGVLQTGGWRLEDVWLDGPSGPIQQVKP